MTLRLYDYWESGNCYKVRLLLALLDIPYERIAVDILKGETQTPEFLAKNANHRVPLLAWSDSRCLAESNAILWHLAEDTPLFPANAWERALTLQWMFFEQYSHEPYIAVVRFWHFSGQLEQHQHLLADKMERGYHALNVMEQHLADHTFFVGDRYTIADIALYAYTHVASEGKFDLSSYSNIQAWFERVTAHLRHIPITAA